MVSIRKIGAVVGGALFLGATLGMATGAMKTVTAPSGKSVEINTDWIAKGGEPQAQLVVGANAPCYDCDKASAEVIKSAVEEKLKVTGAGGDIEISYGKEDLDDDDTVGDTADNITGHVLKNGTVIYDVDTYGNYQLTSNDEGKFLLLGNYTGGIFFDANGDGDVKDTEDYVLYNAIRVQDYREGDIYLAYFPIVTEYQGNDTSKLTSGEVVKIRGTKYVVTDADYSDNEVEMGPAFFARKLDGYNTSDVKPENAVLIEGDKKIIYDKELGKVIFYIGNAKADEITITDGTYKGEDIYDLTDKITADEFKGYKVYVLGYSGPGDNQIIVTMAKKSELTKVTDGEEGVMGYYKVKVGDTDFYNGIVLISELITLERGETLDIPDTYYQIKFTDDREINIKRKKVATVASGTKLKTNREPGKHFLKTDIVVKAVGGDIEISYGKEDLDDDDTVGDTADNITGHVLKNGTVIYDVDTYGNYQLTSNDEGKFLLLGNYTGGIFFDANGDGDVKDTEDYVLYNAIRVQDYREGDIYLAYFPIVTEYQGNDTSKLTSGEVVKIRGTKYVVTDADYSDNEVEMGPAFFARKLDGYNTSDVKPENAVLIEGDKKIIYDKELGKVIFYIGNAKADEITITDGTYKGEDIYDLTDKITADEFKGYKVYVLGYSGPGDNQIIVTMAKKSELTKVTDGEEGVMGYYKVKVGDTDFYNGIVLISELITLERGETLDIPDTYYQIKFTDDREINIKRKKVATVASGTKLKTNREPGKHFLKTDIVVKAVGGEEKTPVLDIVTEDEADKNMNLILVGGPVANTLVSDLVNAGKSKVDWHNSEGDIEVIKDAFKVGKYAIIVAGKDRDATRAAAEALADAL